MDEVRVTPQATGNSPDMDWLLTVYHGLSIADIERILSDASLREDKENQDLANIARKFDALSDDEREIVKGEFQKAIDLDVPDLPETETPVK